MLKRFFRDEAGATSIEYAVIAGLIFLAIIAAIVPIGGQLSTTFDAAATGIKN